MITISVAERSLSDGSKVFDVSVSGDVMAAVTEKDATLLAEAFEAAIDKHSVTKCRITYDLSDFVA